MKNRYFYAVIIINTIILLAGLAYLSLACAALVKYISN